MQCVFLCVYVSGVFSTYMFVNTVIVRCGMYTCVCVWGRPPSSCARTLDGCPLSLRVGGPPRLSLKRPVAGGDGESGLAVAGVHERGLLSAPSS